MIQLKIKILLIFLYRLTKMLIQIFLKNKMDVMIMNCKKKLGDDLFDDDEEKAMIT